MNEEQPVPQPPSPQPRRPGRAARWAWTVLALAIGAALGYVLAQRALTDEAGRRYQALKTRFDAAETQLRETRRALQSHVDTLQGQLLIEEGTRKSLETALESTQNDLARARDQLAFFDRLLPPGPNGSVSIRALDIEPHGPTLQYKVLLMRNAPGSEAFQGTMEFTATGLQDGKPAKIKLKPATAAPAPDGAQGEPGVPMALNFEQFQRSEGLLNLPRGFVPAAVTLAVLEGNTVRASRSINLPSAD